MARRVDTYSRKGALTTTLFCAVLMGVGGTLMFMSAPETLECVRPPGGRASCRLSRAAMGLPWRTDLGFVQGVERKVSTDTRPAFGSSGRTAYQPVAWAQYKTDGGWVDGVQSRNFSDTDDLVTQLTAFLATPSATAFSARISSDARTHAIARGVTIAGAAIQGLWVLGWMVPSLRPKRR